MKLIIDAKTKITASVISALIIGAVHYAGHMWIAPKIFPTANPVIVVGATVVISVFVVAYVGMGWDEYL